MSEIEIDLPILHVDQVRAYRAFQAARFLAIRCGRRWGKTVLDWTIACDYALKGKTVGWFAPEYKYISEAFTEIALILSPLISASSKTEGVIRLKTGGRLDFWSLDNERAGRSRRYHLVIIDEAAFAKNNTMIGIWEKAIRPTLLDFGGKALVTSNTNGIEPENFLWAVCNEPKYGFAEFHAPTHSNPHLPAEELEKLERENPPLVYKQEYLAEFIDWSGEAFFLLEHMLEEGHAVVPPGRCDAVFATIDTATKTGKENDGTAVVYWAFNKHGKHKLVVLDYDIAQIEGSLLEHWLPNVFTNLEVLAEQVGARAGSLGAWIEDKQSGMVLLQQAARRNWPAKPIDSALTSVGKSERAISVSGYVYRGEVKLSERAYDKLVNYKGATRNQLLSQVIGFRIGVKDQVDDDLLDCFTYGISLSLGNKAGF